jgi:type I restriction enzyme M protein
MLNPQTDERILDPSCGTGGFLITGMNHGIDYIERTEREQGLTRRMEPWPSAKSSIAEGSECFRVHLWTRPQPSLVRAAKMTTSALTRGNAGET